MNIYEYVVDVVVNVVVLWCDVVCAFGHAKKNTNNGCSRD
jgi:hypothetical protein